MTTTLKYNLNQINDIISKGFTFEIPEDTIQNINYLCSEVGSSLVLSNIYQKKESVNSLTNEYSSKSPFNKKKKGNKSMESNDEEWESLRTFQTTKIEQKDGIAGEIDQIRLLLNKLTDKTFLDIREKIIEKINFIVSSGTFNMEDSEKISDMIYTVSSTNKFYSKIFADLYVELVTTYNWLRPLFDKNMSSLINLFKNIEYCDPNIDYDKFCDNNKQNEKRRAVAMFYINLTKNDFINKKFVIIMTKNLLQIIMDFIENPDKKNEVDELTENVSILYNKELFDEYFDANDNDPEDSEYTLENNETIMDTITSLANLKAKDYPGLSNKAIFKYMDMIEM
jgi:hypothetical protein